HAGRPELLDHLVLGQRLPRPVPVRPEPLHVRADGAEPLRGVGAAVHVDAPGALVSCIHLTIRWARRCAGGGVRAPPSTLSTPSPATDPVRRRRSTSTCGG